MAPLLAACMPLDDLASYSKNIEQSGTTPDATAPPRMDEPTTDVGDILDASLRPAPAPGSIPPADAGVPPATAPARVLSHDPPAGAVGVAGDTALTITFDQPMSTESVQSALESTTLPLSSAAYSWSENDTVLRIVLPAALAEAEGSEITAVVANCYEYRLSAAARDAAGRSVQPSTVSFCTRRRLNQVFPAACERDLTGNWRSDGIYGDGNCGREATVLCIGDSGFAPNQQYRGFVTFDLSSLSEPLLAVTSAQLALQVLTVNGRPFPGLGSLLLESLSFQSIGPDAFLDASAQVIGALEASAGSETTWVGDATGAARNDIGGPSQYRLRFTAVSDGDSTSDHFVTSCSDLSLQVTSVVP